MEYVEFLRVRNLLKWYGLVLGVSLIGGLAFGHETTINVVGSAGTSHLSPGFAVPLAALVPVAMFLAAIFGSSAGTSLSREFLLRDIAWTKPLSRTLLAARYVLVDLAAMTVLFAATLAVVVAVLQRIDIPTTLTSDLGPQLLLGLGVGFMWYALLQLLTCRLPPAGMSLAGILWPVALFALGLSDSPGWFGALDRALDVVNPLAYMSGVSFTGGDARNLAVWQLPADERAAIVWGFAVLFSAMAIALWQRREV